jgi:hypothetical protein
MTIQAGGISSETVACHLNLHFQCPAMQVAMQRSLKNTEEINH